MAPREDVRRALIRRVVRKVSGHGITRGSIEGAVDRVLAALPEDGRAPAAVVPQVAAQVAALSAASAPDLASRARRVLEREGARVIAMGTGTAGRHTVVTVHVPAGSDQALQRAAAELGASLSLLGPSDASRFGT